MRRKKSFSVPRLMALVFILFLVIIIAVTIISFVRADRIMNIAPSPLDPFATNVIGKHQNVSFRSAEDQYTLKGWWLPHTTKDPKGTVILIHDRGANRLQFSLDTHHLYSFFTDSGFNVLAFDQRGCGDSSSGLHAYGYNVYEDVLAAIKYAKGKTPSLPLILMGYGAGNSAIWHAWNSLPSSLDEQVETANADEINLSRNDISGIIMDTPAKSTEDCIKSDIDATRLPLRKLFYWSIPLAIRLSTSNSADLDFLNLILDAPCPIYMTRNKFDEVYPPENINSLFSEVARLRSSTATIFETEGQGHVTGWIDQQGAYKDELGKFLQQWFGN